MKTPNPFTTKENQILYKGKSFVNLESNLGAKRWTKVLVRAWALGRLEEYNEQQDLKDAQQKERVKKIDYLTNKMFES
jgi:hypothetical protein